MRSQIATSSVLLLRPKLLNGLHLFASIAIRVANRKLEILKPLHPAKRSLKTKSPALWPCGQLDATPGCSSCDGQIR